MPASLKTPVQPTPGLPAVPFSCLRTGSPAESRGAVVGPLTLPIDSAEPTLLPGRLGPRLLRPLLEDSPCTSGPVAGHFSMGLRRVPGEVPPTLGLPSRGCGAEREGEGFALSSFGGEGIGHCGWRKHKDLVARGAACLTTLQDVVQNLATRDVMS